MDRPTDDLLRRILAAAASEAGGPVARRLVVEARAEAEAEVKALLKSAMKAALLRAAAEHLEAESQISHLRSQPSDQNPASSIRGTPQAAESAPATSDPRTRTHTRTRTSVGPPSNGIGVALPSENDLVPGEIDPQLRPTDDALAGTACYLYAITAEGPDAWSADLVGVDGTRPPEFVRHEDLQAIVSHVPLEVFGQCGLNERATDPEWIEEKVRAHDRMIKRAMAGGCAVIPCRFCTVLRDADDVRRLLTVHANEIRLTLETLDGKQEWGVKVYAREPAEVAREVAESLVGGNDAGPAAGRAGTAYLQRRRHEDALRGEVERAARARALACHEELEALADEAVVLPRRGSGNGARRGPEEPVLNGAYLVPEACVEQFHAAVADMQERDRPVGLEFEVTGPWPPYNFVRLDLSLAGAP